MKYNLLKFDPVTGRILQRTTLAMRDLAQNHADMRVAYPNRLLSGVNFPAALWDSNIETLYDVDVATHKLRRVPRAVVLERLSGKGEDKRKEVMEKFDREDR